MLAGQKPANLGKVRASLAGGDVGPRLDPRLRILYRCFLANQKPQKGEETP
jgi:hypothetical protein